MAELVCIDATAPEVHLITRAVELLRQGELVALPSETVYGLAADAENLEAIQKIYAVKGRPSQNPLIMHVLPDFDWRSYVQTVPAEATLLIKHFWPGPLTLVLRKTDKVPDLATGFGPTVALRAPQHPVFQAVLRQLQRPIFAPSANRSGQLSPTQADHVLRDLGDALRLILDAGPTSKGLESTVLDLTVHPVRCLRLGALSLQELRKIIPELTLGSGNEELRSPGMLRKHYSPRTALECFTTRDELAFCQQIYETAGLKTCSVELTQPPEIEMVHFYARLHQLDRSGYDRILVVLPPDEEAWAPLRDRLLRASAEDD